MANESHGDIVGVVGWISAGVTTALLRQSPCSNASKSGAEELQPPARQVS